MMVVKETRGIYKAIKFPADRARGKCLVILELNPRETRRCFKASKLLGVTFEEMAARGLSAGIAVAVGDAT